MDSVIIDTLFDLDEPLITNYEMNNEGVQIDLIADEKIWLSCIFQTGFKDQDRLPKPTISI
jgi:hypothetical protein